MKLQHLADKLKMFTNKSRIFGHMMALNLLIVVSDEFNVEQLLSISLWQLKCDSLIYRSLNFRNLGFLKSSLISK